MARTQVERLVVLEIEVRRRPNDFEDAVIGALLDGEHPILEQLRRQQGRCLVTERTRTTSGVFTDLEVPAGIPVDLPYRLFTIHDVYLNIVGLECGASAILYVSGGLLYLLECVSNAHEPWPDQPELASPPYYGGSGERDMAWVESFWT